MRLIDADVAICTLEKTSLNGGFVAMTLTEFAKRTLKDAPTIDAQPVVHGEWAKKYDTLSQDYCSDNNWYYVCSECGKGSGLASYYCPHCGAKMDKAKEDG